MVPDFSRGPHPMVDVLVERNGCLLLVRRRHDPLGWALPGGFVDPGEMVAAAAVREALEETGVRVTLKSILHVYSDPARDHRRHTITTAFVAEGEGEPIGGDDAAEAVFFPLDQLPSPIVFDHAKIIADYCHFRLTGVRPDPYV